MAQWILKRVGANYDHIAKRFYITPLTARLLVNRGLTEDAVIEQYLHPSDADFGDGALLADMDRAITLLCEAIRANKRIRIIGDYDIDGIQSTYILHQGLLHVGANADYAIPHRIEDGYGLNVHLIEQCIADGIDLIITCDNGIAAAKEIAFAKENGITVIVTDHHEVPYTLDANEKRIYLLPPADAVVDPKRADDPYPCKKLCGAVVAWKVILQLYPAIGYDADDAMIFLENAAFATVGDVMELVEENRSIVALGLSALEHTTNIGMRALLDACDLSDKGPINVGHVGFILGPSMNASGRLDSAIRCVELLEATDPTTAGKLALELRTLNDERKSMTQDGVDQAIEAIEAQGQSTDKVLVVYLPGLHESIAGIVAGRIRERYERPTFVLTDSANSDEVKGSGRSTAAFSMYDEMCKCKELFTKFGGHPMAAGLSLLRENIDAFRTAMNENCKVPLKELGDKIYIDADMNFSYLLQNRVLIDELSLLAPFGMGNTTPAFALRNVRIIEKKPIGKEKQFLRLLLEDADGCRITGVYFKDREKWDAAEHDGHITILYEPQFNEFHGQVTVQINIKNVC